MANNITVKRNAKAGANNKWKSLIIRQGKVATTVGAEKIQICPVPDIKGGRNMHGDECGCVSGRV